MTRLLLVIPCLVGAALVDVNEATLSEITDTSLTTRDDYHVIADWQR